MLTADLGTHRLMYIDGEWIDARERFEIINPATEEVVATVARGRVEHADRAVEAAARAHRGGGAIEAASRAGPTYSTRSRPGSSSGSRTSWRSRSPRAGSPLVRPARCTSAPRLGASGTSA